MYNEQEERYSEGNSTHVAIYQVSGEGSGVKYTGHQCLLRAVFKIKTLLVSQQHFSPFTHCFGDAFGQLPTLDLSSLLTKRSLSPVPWVQPTVCESVGELERFSLKILTFHSLWQGQVTETHPWPPSPVWPNKTFPQDLNWDCCFRKF